MFNLMPIMLPQEVTGLNQDGFPPSCCSLLGRFYTKIWMMEIARTEVNGLRCLCESEIYSHKLEQRYAGEKHGFVFLLLCTVTV